MTREIADGGVVVRLHLPPPPLEEPAAAVRPRRGGIVLAVLGVLVALAAGLAWSRDDAGRTWLYLVLVWVGAHQVIAGLTFALRPRR